jgi:crotonobetainyl-CoA:carnitine CoA-transferase CaiB-like acyl-CoA transferase
LNAKLRLRPTADWMGYLHQQRIPCGPILNLKQVFEDPQVLHNGMVVEQQHPAGGQRRLLGFPLTLSATPGAIRTPAPGLGEHTEAVLGELGYTRTQLAMFRRDGVI